MKALTFFLVILLSAGASAHAKLIHEKVAYELDGITFRGHLIYDERAAIGTENLPCIFMVPNWMGPDTESTLAKAKKIAGSEFAVFVADMYGVTIRPTNGKEAGAAAGFVRSDRELMRARAGLSIETFKSLADEHPINPDKMLGIGFCFGGGTLLEYSRTGSKELSGIVSFHGDLKSPTLQDDANAVKIPLLVLHGADDPYVPQSDVQIFIDALLKSNVDDWQLVQFSGTVHSFTDPSAQSEGARYDERTAKRAFRMMSDFAVEVLE
jgi:dienelactone hydrolase